MAKMFSAHRPFRRDFDSLGVYHDFWIKVQSDAPDELTYSFLEVPVDQVQALLDAFESLHRGLNLAKRKLKDDRRCRVAEELLRMAYDFYSSGARKQGIACMQEAEGLIWPSLTIKPNFAFEAERRAFGDLTLYADARQQRYEGEVTVEQLGAHQRLLFDVARDRMTHAIQQGRESCKFFLAVTAGGEVVEVKKPSRKKILEEARRRVSDAEIVAFVSAELVFLGVSVLDLEQVNTPRVSARAPIKDGSLQVFRFFLEDPVIFPLEDAQGR